MKLQRREHTGSSKPRLVQGGREGGRIIEGYAVVFGKLSGLLRAKNTEHEIFREVIEPGAITKELLSESDIIMNLGHENYKLLARSSNGRGTLSFWIDSKGVGFRFAAPNTNDGNFAIEHVRLGNITGCSFAFYDGTGANDVTWTKGSDGYFVRHVRRISAVCDFSLVLHPAYPQTMVSQSSDKRQKEASRKAAERTRHIIAMQLDSGELEIHSDSF